ncbi:MAG: OmpA family protein [Campylobacterota bacterium]|nr:OmpA family protein [Campylobacterota bacterium]
MKQIILLTLFVLSTLYSKTSDYSVIIDKPFSDALFDVTEDYDRTISAVGFSREFKQDSTSSKTYTNAFDYLSSVSNKHGSQIHLLKVNNRAEVVLSKATKLSRFTEAVALAKTPSNGYYIGGYTLDGDLLILKVDSVGNIIFNKTFGTKNYDRMNNLVLMSDGGVLAVGSSVTSRSANDNIFETGLGQNDIYITRFSKDGAKLWSKKYGTRHDDRGIDAAEARDGSIVVVSTTAYEKNKNVTLMRITENGNRMWLKHYKSENLVIPRKIIKLRDNNFVVSLSEYNNMHKEQIRLIKFDLYKNVIADKKIFTTYPSALNDIKEYSDGSFIGVGYVKDTYNTDGLVMMIDSNLNMINQEHYGKEQYDVLNAVTILHNSQAAAAGLHTNNNSQETNMWIAKFNRDASLAQISTSVTDFHKKLSDIFKEDIDKNRLIIREDLTIELKDKALYFEVGEHKLTELQKEFLDKLAKKLVPFLKVNVDKISALEINGHTSSEWGTQDFANGYIKNEKLSMNRSFSVLSYIFLNQSKPTQIQLSKILRGSGFSYSKKIMLNDKEDRKKSRRVTFKIILK